MSKASRAAAQQSAVANATAAPTVVKATPVQKQASAARTRTVSGPVKRGKSLVPQPGDLPDGWGDTEKIVEWAEPSGEDFGAFVPPVADGGATEIQTPPTLVMKKRRGDVEDDDDLIQGEDEAEAAATEEAEAEAAAAGTVKVASETEEDAAGAEGDTTEATEATETAAGATQEPVKPESNALLRRRIMDSLKVEGENRALQERLKAEQDARAAERTAREAAERRVEEELGGLRKGPLEERLRRIGFNSKEELTEAIVRGEVPDFQPAAEPPKPAAAETDVAQIRAELAELRTKNQVQDVLRRAGSNATPDEVMEAAKASWTAAGAKEGTQIEHINRAIGDIVTTERTIGAATTAIKTELDNVEAYPAPLTRATKGGMEAVQSTAVRMWRAAGAKPGEYGKWAKFALEAAEDVYAEQYGPVIAAAGGTLPGKTPAAKPPAAAAPKPGAKPPARPAPPVGRRVAARASAAEEDDGPQDPKLRDIWVKDQMAKATGSSGWNT